MSILKPLKTIKISPNIGQHDLDVRMKQARKFLTKGHKVRINLRFKGRQMAHQDLGMDKVTEVIDNLKEYGRVETPAKKQGYEINALLIPTRSILDKIKNANK